MKPTQPSDRIIVALDVPGVDEARKLIDQLDDTVSFFKIGMQLQFAGGLDLAKELVTAGKKVFLDVKLLDIDNTIKGGVENIARLGVTFMTLHAYPKTMRAAVSAAHGSDLALLGVTVLTSMDDDDLIRAGYTHKASELVEKRARDALVCGMSGIVCSPMEAARMRSLLGPDMLIVTPGIRSAGADPDDQKRIATPSKALSDGADYLVIGRPITRAHDPKAAAQAIIEEIQKSV